MRLPTLIFLGLVLALLSNRAKAAHPASAQPAVTQTAPAAGTAQTDTQDLRQDIARMKALVQQMEQNLAFVDTTQSPLKHQFQLEIDMWKTMIGEMERKLNSSRHP